MTSLLDFAKMLHKKALSGLSDADLLAREKDLKARVEVDESDRKTTEVELELIDEIKTTRGLS